MMESRVFAIKLFGRMISLHPNGGGEEEKILQTSEVTSEHKDRDQEILLASLESSKEEDTSIQENSVHEEQSKSTGNSGEKARKKPGDLLPCPRCKSTNTKFCYYNNYNISQPRHFCKNCQRYWTAGGSMRNVPVGAGRRKSKISASHCRRITMSIRPDDVLLRFDSDESTQKISEQTTTKNCHMELNSEEEAKSIKNSQGIPAVPLSLPCLDGNSWAYPWSPTPAICAPSFAIPLYPAAAYNAYWSIPWPSPLADKPKNGLSGSGTNSPTLGKHPRDGNMNKDDNPIKGGYLKETAKRNCMRIDDPDEAAKSSICAIVDVKNNKGDAVSRQSLFTAFQPKVDGRNQATENCHLLHANPVALLRSLTFHEAS